MKYKSKSGVYYWAEKVPQIAPHKTVVWAVISQVPGYPATEAHDDWFGFKADAEQVAKDLSEEKEMEV